MATDQQSNQQNGTLAVCCPRCGGTNVSTLEALSGVLPVYGYDPALGEFEYGLTEVDWESSTTRTDARGRPMLECRDCCAPFSFIYPNPVERAPAPSRPPHQTPTLQATCTASARHRRPRSNVALFAVSHGELRHQLRANGVDPGRLSDEQYDRIVRAVDGNLAGLFCDWINGGGVYDVLQRTLGADWSAYEMENLP